MKTDLTPNFIEQLKEISQRKCWTDEEDFNPLYFSNGNYDDAYSGGLLDGEALLAREILENLERDE